MRVKYVLSEVLVGLWRNVTMTIAMIITMAVSLTMLGASLLLYLQVDEMKDLYYEQVEVSIFLQERRHRRSSARRSRPSSTATRWSRSVDLREQGAGVRAVQGACSATRPTWSTSVRPDELPESFRVKLKDPEQFEQIDDRVQGHCRASTTIVDQQKLLEKVFDILGSIQNLALVVAVVMGVAALLLVANTIQVAAYSKRREVAVMKLVGASNWFIQAPFVLEAVVAGLIGSLLGLVALVVGEDLPARRLAAGADRPAHADRAGATSC